MYQSHLERVMAQHIEDCLINGARTAEPRQQVLLTASVGDIRALGYAIPDDLPNDTPVDVVLQPPPPIERREFAPENVVFLCGSTHGKTERLGLFEGHGADRVNVTRRYAEKFDRLANAMLSIGFEACIPKRTRVAKAKATKPRPVPTWKRTTKGRHCRPW